jgi:hypothetical protein
MRTNKTAPPVINIFFSFYFYFYLKQRECLEGTKLVRTMKLFISKKQTWFIEQLIAYQNLKKLQ